MRQPEASRMTVDEFLAWAEAQPGDMRYELVDGYPVAMSPERNIHAHLKAKVYRALEDSIEAKSLPCMAWPDGATVRIDDHTVYEPDASMSCGDDPKANDIALLDPIIVVEVLSPGTQRTDSVQKLRGYFIVPSIRHYLIFDPTPKTVVHCTRDDDGKPDVKVITEGTIDLSPPGITIDIDQIYRDAWKGLSE